MKYSTLLNDYILWLGSESVDFFKLFNEKVHRNCPCQLKIRYTLDLSLLLNILKGIIPCVRDCVFALSFQGNYCKNWDGRFFHLDVIRFSASAILWQSSRWLRQRNILHALCVFDTLSEDCSQGYGKKIDSVNGMDLYSIGHFCR